MEGTIKKNKKTYLRIIAVVLIAMVVIIAILAHSHVKVSSVTLHPKNEEEDYKYSFYEGAQLGTYNAKIGILFLDGKITRRECERFNKLTEKLVFECNLETLSKTYCYAAYLLKSDIKFYYHENPNKVAYMQGFAVQTNIIMCNLYYEEGEVDGVSYKKIKEMYGDLINNPTSDKVDELLDFIDEAMRGIIVDELESSSTIILLT